jgi:formylglycine-generating enzyme required for sulfatase activity
MTRHTIVLIVLISMAGFTCSEPGTDPCRDITCSDRGTCSVVDGDPLCTCVEGYAGDNCEGCAAGYHQDGGICVADVACGADSCSGNGSCDDSTGVVICTCDAGYAGDHCGSCDTGYQDNDGDGACLPDCAGSGLDCGLFGDCDDATGTAACVCDQGYAGTSCQTCAAGYQDNDDDDICLPDCSAPEAACNPHEYCDDSSGTALCFCLEGYTGPTCDTCDAGYQDNDGNGDCLPDCSNNDCSGHGTCDDASGVAGCTCDEHFFGPRCSAEFVLIQGGQFEMGCSTSSWSNERPVHTVNVPSFYIMKTEVTVAMYRQCVEDNGSCSLPGVDETGSDEYTNWDVAGRDDHPINYIDWFQAYEFCDWLGGRLLSEAEWEYAARGEGRDVTYPWGDTSPDCTLAVFGECGQTGTEPVCSRPDGNTPQGLCDMAGNVWERVQDRYNLSYDGAPDDGSAWEWPSWNGRVNRGGSWAWTELYSLRVAYRFPEWQYNCWRGMGTRCAMSVE